MPKSVSRPRARSPILALASLASFLALAGTAAATTWNVPGDLSNTCTVVSPNCNTIAQAVTAASNGDTVQLGAGTFSGTGNFGILLTKTLTIAGAGRTSTFVQPNAGQFGFSIRASGIVIRDLALQNGATGVNFQSVASNNTQFQRVDFTGNTSRGIDISTAAAAPVSNVSIADCKFATPNIGIRMASNSQVSNLAIADSTFVGNLYGIYQANDGNTSKLIGFTVDNTEFLNNTSYGIYTEEMRDATIEDSTFTNNGVGMLLLKLYTGSGVAASNIAIRRNEFTHHRSSALDIEILSGGLETGIEIADNTIDLDVSVPTSNASAIFVALKNAFTHAPVTVTGNTITLSGAFATATAAHGIRVRGNGPLVLTGNLLDGGGVGGTATAPVTSGLYIESNAPGTFSGGLMPATATFDASCNRITGFRNGVSVFDSVNGVYGGLQAGTTVDLAGNAILGNSDAGVATGAGAPTVDAEGTYWGCPTGPGDPGCDAVAGNVDASPALAVVPACIACLQNSECSDGLICNGAETCDTMSGLCVAGTGPDCSSYGDQCNTGSCVDPVGCTAVPVADDTVCSAAPDVCSEPDTCQAGACEDGGGGDSGDGICVDDDNCPSIANPDQSDVDGDGAGDLCDDSDAQGLSLRKLQLRKARKPGTDRWSAMGEIDTSSTPSFLADAVSGGLILTLENQAGGVIDSEAFAPGECRRVGASQINLKCKNAVASQVSFATRPSTGFFRFTIRVKGQTLSLPTLPGDLPLAVTVTSPVSIDRRDSIPSPSGSCKQRAGVSVTCKE